MTEFIPFATKNSALKTRYSQFVKNCALKNRLQFAQNRKLFANRRQQQVTNRKLRKNHKLRPNRRIQKVTNRKLREIANCAQFAICEKLRAQIIDCDCAAIANFRYRNRNLRPICENRKKIYIPGSNIGSVLLWYQTSGNFFESTCSQMKNLQGQPEGHRFSKGQISLLSPWSLINCRHKLTQIILSFSCVFEQKSWQIRKSKKYEEYEYFISYRKNWAFCIFSS